MFAEGRINRQVHPDLPIHVLNYSAKAQYMNKWTQSERVCRGLILEDHTLNVIARGPAKFFNYGDPRVPQVDLDSPVRATVKHDGSLGIGWRYEGHYGIATRGSFMSPQAQHASAMIDDRIGQMIYESSMKFLKGGPGEGGGCTRIFEIVYPENRIVLDYGDRDELIELGEVLNEDGVIHFRPAHMYRTPVITLAEAFKLPVDDDEEGFVLDVQPKQRHLPWGRADDFHVKIKGETYKLLHGLLTNTNARRIWTQLAWRACHSLLPEAEEGTDAAEKIWAYRLGNDPADFKRVDVTKTIEETFLEQVPDEFYSWVTRQIDSIEDNVYSLLGQGMVLADKIRDMPKSRERHEMVKNHPLVTEIIRYVDYGDATGMTVLAWKLSKPGDETPFKTQEED
jgi:RNA ligase